MNKFKSYDKTQRTQSNTAGQLPVGGYVCKIISAKEESYSWGSKLAVAFDISEGDFKGYFDEQYKSNPYEDKKWKGVLRITVPTDDGTEQAERDARKFKNFICDIEDSNNGYSWDWDEAKLKGKTIGILFNEGEYNGHRYTKAYQSATADNIRNGKFKIWQPELKEQTAPIENNTEDDDDDLPF